MQLLMTCFFVVWTLNHELDALEIENFTLDDNVGHVDVAMNTFPDTCCHDYSATIRYTGSMGKHIRLQFTDIDLPDRSILLLLDEDNEKYIDQPLFLNGMYARQGFAFNKSVVKIAFKPPDREQSRYYAGFKATFWTTEGDSTSWRFWPLSERCPRLASTDDGGALQIQNDPTMYGYGVNNLPYIPMYDCIWVIKIPQIYMNSKTFKPRVYVSLLDLQIPDALMVNTLLEVRRGKSSAGTLLARITADDDSSSLENDDMLWTADDAIYVRLQMPYTSKTSDENTVYNIRIGYGIYTPAPHGFKACEFGNEEGVTCLTEGWCVPDAYKCNGLSNCPGLEDENNFNCAEVKKKRTKMLESETRSTTMEPTLSIDMPLDPRATLDRGPMSRSGASESGCDTFEKLCYSNYDNAYVCEGAFTRCPGTSCRDFDAYCSNGDCVYLDSLCEYSGCVFGKKKCPDGRCVGAQSSCACREKECVSGACVSYDDRCPEDNCPYVEPYKCADGSKCYPSSYECDGVEDCVDGSDEATCHSSDSEDSSSTALASFVTIIVIPCICLCVMGSCCAACVKKKRANTSNTAGETGTNMTPVATAGPRPVITGYAPVPRNDQTPYPIHQPTAPPLSNDVTMGLPDYNEAVNMSTYPRTQRSPSPPSYFSATSKTLDISNAPERVEYWSSGSFMPIQ